MAKSSGIGAGLLVDQYLLSNDVQQVQISGGPNLLDVTGIDKSAFERIGGLRDGSINKAVFFNDDTDRAHPVLSQLPTANTNVTYAHRITAVEDPAASIIAKQLNYDGTRAPDGMFTFDVQNPTADLGLVWGVLGTPGVVDVTTTGNQASIDNGAASSNGLRAFIHVTEFTGTDATVVIQESSDDGAGDAFTAVASFTSITAESSEAISITGAVEQYLRVSVTVDNFTTMSFAVNIARL